MEHEGFIVPPPGLIPDTVEAPPRPAPAVAPASFPTFAPVSAPAPPPDPVVPADEAAPHGPWVLALDDGQRFQVGGSLVLGRDPAPVPVRQHATLVPVVDPAKSVSKTHAIVDLEGAELSITDLHSTNGVLVTDAHGAEHDLDPGERVVLSPGDKVELGTFAVRVERA
ncbi:FHA domain-containing protein [Agromyces laixinhei]|uniref:FHA domain-containing protein n=1 Tax=Agromyces laixinhei TaxID=2585717 RepID=UPI0012ECC1D6|nr:FHA domain-containing protein [Agromyces laixinhei]